MFEKGLLAGKRILVTGGGSGLGAAMGRRFVELGAELIICGRRLELLEATAAQMRSETGARVSVARCDIRDGAAVESALAELKRAATTEENLMPPIIAAARARATEGEMIAAMQEIFGTYTESPVF